VDIIEVLLRNPGLYIGRGVGVESSVEWIGRIEVRRLPGGGA
jgi:hypothetical protein